MTVNCKICGKQFDSFRGLNGHMNAHLKRLSSEDNEEIDDEDYWEPYLEALEVLWWHCVSYVDYASETYCGIVECINLWSNVAEHKSAHTIGYIVNKTHKFKLEAIRYIWDDDPNYVWEKLESETRELLENFNPEGRDYEGSHIPTMYSGWPSLNDIKEDFNPRWLPHRESAYAFDLYDAEEYTKRTGSRVTKGRKQRWIPVAIEYIRTHGKSTAAEIHPSLPDHRSAATPIHAMALSNRLIRMPDIFIVDKSRKPYTYSLVETKEAESVAVEACRQNHLMCDNCMAVCLECNLDANAGGDICRFCAGHSVERFGVETKEMSLEDDERICFTCGEITSDWDLINEGYECSKCSELNRTDYERRKFGVEAYDEKITVWICSGCNHRYEDQNDADRCCVEIEAGYHRYLGAEGAKGTSRVKVYVEREDNRTWKYVTFELPNHILNNEDILHEAIEARLMDILQEPFGGWDLISTEDLGAESVVNRPLGEIPDWELRMMYKQGKISKAQMHIGIGLKMEGESFSAEEVFKCSCGGTLVFDEECLTYVECDRCGQGDYQAESFEANYDPTQARDGKGRWTDNESNEVTIDLDSDELSALADAIREQDETFPDVGMLLDQIGDTPENREVIFQEMLEVLSGFINEVMDTPQIESQEEYYKYILEEPAEDAMGRLYRQANYYAQFKNSVEIEEALEELHFQYQMVKEMDGPDEVVDSIEKDINFVELVSRIQDMQREYRADWNPKHPRVPCPTCKKPIPCPCPKPGKGGKGKGGEVPFNQDPITKEELWVNKITGALWAGKTSPGAEWRQVERVPVIIDGKQRFIKNIFEDIVKMFPASAYLYQKNPPSLIIIDNKITIPNIKGIQIKGQELTYE